MINYLAIAPAYKGIRSLLPPTYRGTTPLFYLAIYAGRYVYFNGSLTSAAFNVRYNAASFTFMLCESSRGWNFQNFSVSTVPRMFNSSHVRFLAYTIPRTYNSSPIQLPIYTVPIYTSSRVQFQTVDFSRKIFYGSTLSYYEDAS